MSKIGKVTEAESRSGVARVCQVVGHGQGAGVTAEGHRGNENGMTLCHGNDHTTLCCLGLLKPAALYIVKEGILWFMNGITI